MWTPTHVLVTVIRAKSLLDKGKGGNDAYCIIGMGKEKFLTSVRAKTLEPQWGEQAEFNLNERADLKITVYHKSSIIDEFIGRVTLDVSSLLGENDKTVTKWYKLAGKPDKSGGSGKSEKQRGEIEVRVDFIAKPKTGSMMDLSMKSNDHTLSLRNLNGSGGAGGTGSFRATLGDKLKNGFGKSKRDKYGAENQLSDQVKNMGGGSSKADFLDGEDLSSLASSYSSLNDPNSIRSGFTQGSSEVKKINSMSRFNPARKSIMSRTSSNRADNNDLSSLNENDDNDLDLESSANKSQQQQGNNNNSDNYTFNRRNSSRRFGGGGSFASRRSYITPSSTTEAANNNTTSAAAPQDSTSSSDHPSEIHIAPLPSFFDDDFAPSIEQMLKKSIFDKEKKHAPPPPPLPSTTIKPEAPKAPTAAAASIAIDDLFVKTTSPPPRKNKAPVLSRENGSESTVSTNAPSATSDFFDMSKTESQVYSTPVESGNGKNDQNNITLSNDNDITESNTDDNIDFSYFDLYKKKDIESNGVATKNGDLVAPPPPQIIAHENPFGDEEQLFDDHSSHDNKMMDEEDQIDWVSSDDEDILKKVEKEVQVLSRNNPMENSNNMSSSSVDATDNTVTTTTTTTTNNNVEMNDLDKQTDEFINSITLPPSEEQIQEEEEQEENVVTFAAIPDDIGQTVKSNEEVNVNPLEAQLLNSQSAYNELYNAMSDDFDEVKNDSDDDDDASSSLDLQRVETNPVEFAKMNSTTVSERIYENVNRQQEEETTVEELRLKAFDEINVDDVSLDSETTETRLLDTTTTNNTTDEQQQQQVNLNETRASNESRDHHQSELHHNGLPDLLNQKTKNDTNSMLSNGMPPVNKIPAEKSLDEVRFNEVEVPESLAKQLEFYDRDELLRLIAYQKKYLDYKESRIRDLENYIDNLVVKIIETEPSILMNASNILSKNIRI